MKITYLDTHLSRVGEVVPFMNTTPGEYSVVALCIIGRNPHAPYDIYYIDDNYVSWSAGTSSYSDKKWKSFKDDHRTSKDTSDMMIVSEEQVIGWGVKPCE
jgi:hypothetical protein